MNLAFGGTGRNVAGTLWKILDIIFSMMDGAGIGVAVWCPRSGPVIELKAQQFSGDQSEQDLDWVGELSIFGGQGTGRKLEWGA